MARSRSFPDIVAADAGFSILEVMVATALLAVALVSLAQLFGIATKSNFAARRTTYAGVLGEQKMEELRGLTYGFDAQGLPVTDNTTDTSVTPENPIGGTGLTPSPSNALQQNTAGYVDYIDQFGNKLGGGATAPQNTAYIRRWSVEPLPTNPNNVVIIQVLVTPNKSRGDADKGNVGRLPDEARLATVKARKAQ